VDETIVASASKLAVVAFVLIGIVTSAQAQSLSPQDVSRRNAEWHAVDSAIWRIPATNYDTAVGKPTQLAYWSQLVDGNDQLPSKQPNTTRNALSTSRYVQATESSEWITDTYVGRGCQFR
jgi:hypothetical protein